MANVIDEKMVEYVAMLAQLELSRQEREAAGNDMRRMLDYVDQLNELNTEGVEPLAHLFAAGNVFREDVVENGDCRDDILSNAPESRDGTFRVPRTVE